MAVVRRYRVRGGCAVSVGGVRINNLLGYYAMVVSPRLRAARCRRHADRARQPAQSFYRVADEDAEYMRQQEAKFEVRANCGGVGGCC